MTSSSETDQRAIETLAQQTGFTTAAVAAMMRSVASGGGRMAQFDHPEFGGPGQWMQGGMSMIADFSDHALKQRIVNLCEAIARDFPDGPPAAIGGSFQRQSQSGHGHAHEPDSRTSHPWWPASLGSPATSGAQDGLRYAWFARPRRLAIEHGGSVTLYDTGDHRIDGVSQQQGGHRTLAFTSQHGPVDLSRLPVAAAEGPVARDAPTRSATAPAASANDPFAALEKLAALHARGIVSDDEFARKKADLLARV